MPKFRARYRAESYVWAEEIIEADTQDAAEVEACARLYADRMGSTRINWQEGPVVPVVDIKPLSQVVEIKPVS